MTPLPPPTIAAIDDGVVRGAERRDGDQPRSGRQAPGDRVDRGDLDRRRRLQRRQDRRQPLGQHRLARARRAEQGQVVPAGRADLHREPRLRLAEHLRQVQLLGHVRSAAGAGPGGGSGTAGSDGGGPPRSQMITSRRLLAPTTWTPGTRAASATFCAATTTVSTPASAATTAGSTPGTGRSRPSRPSSARNIFPASAADRHRLGGGEDGHGDGQVKARSALGQGRGREADGDLRVRPALPAVDDRRADPVPCLAQGRVRQADQDRRGQPAGDVRLHLDQVAADPDEGHRVGTGERHLTPPPGHARS